MYLKGLKFCMQFFLSLIWWYIDQTLCSKVTWNSYFQYNCVIHLKCSWVHLSLFSFHFTFLPPFCWFNFIFENAEHWQDFNSQNYKNERSVTFSLIPSNLLPPPWNRFLNITIIVVFQSSTLPDKILFLNIYLGGEMWLEKMSEKSSGGAIMKKNVQKPCTNLFTIFIILSFWKC